MRIVLFIFLAIVVMELHFVECFVASYEKSASNACNKTQNDGNFLKEIFIGRCFYFYNILKKTECFIIDKNYDCPKIWLKFEETVKKSNCNVSDFDDLFKLTDHNIPENETVFWSGTYTPAHQCKLHNFF
jgi:hypothetical protein